LELERDELSKHLRSLKLLSLFFERIYIPRSHLLTWANDTHQRICIEFLRSEIFECFSKAGILLLSTRPGMSSIDDTVRITDRIHGLGWLSTPEENYALDHKLSITNSWVVDSVEWSMDTGESTGSLIDKWRDIAGDKIGTAVFDAFRRSQTDDTPFLHERFLGLIRESDLPNDVKEDLWAQTNDVYLMIPTETIRGFVSYDPKERPLGSRKLLGSTMVDTRFYAPAFLREFLDTVVGGKVIARILTAPSTSFVYCRTNMWALFRQEYHKLVQSMTEKTRLLELGLISEQDIFLDPSELIYNSLGFDLFPDHSDITTALSSVGTGAASLLDPASALAARFASGSTRGYVRKLVEKLVWSTKHKNIMRYLGWLRSNMAINR